MLRALLGTSLLALTLIAACSGSDRKNDDDDDDGSTTQGSGGSTGSGGAGGGSATMQSCYPTCVVVTDCMPASPNTLYDADNYTCTDGKCSWTGCNNTDECTSTLGSLTYVCATAQGATIRTCHPTCMTVADCAPSGSPPLYDADNYACNEGRCEWTGCNDNTECASAFGASSTCVAQPGSTAKSCVQTCATAEDCITAESPIYDADNYACNNGICAWTGCNDTAECTDTYMSQDYVCE